jgi:hypothetical protein
MGANFFVDIVNNQIGDQESQIWLLKNNEESPRYYNMMIN